MKVTDMLKGFVDPRGNIAHVDPDLVDRHVVNLRDLVSEYGSDEFMLAEKLRLYVAEHLRCNTDLYIAVNDALAERGILSKKHFKDYMSLVLEV